MQSKLFSCLLKCCICLNQKPIASNHQTCNTSKISNIWVHHSSNSMPETLTAISTLHSLYKYMFHINPINMQYSNKLRILLMNMPSRVCNPFLLSSDKLVHLLHTNEITLPVHLSYYAKSSGNVINFTKMDAPLIYIVSL